MLGRGLVRGKEKKKKKKRARLFQPKGIIRRKSGVFMNVAQCLDGPAEKNISDIIL